MSKKTAGVRELKAQLSAYLRRVEAGDVVLVTDRGRVVAELREPAAAPYGSPGDYHRLVDRGLVRPGSTPDERSWTRWKGLGLARGKAGRLLDAERDE